MPVLPLLTYPDPKLKLIAPPIEHMDDTIRQHAQDMIDTINSMEQVGAIAATQLGIPWRMVVFHQHLTLPFGGDDHMVGINPVVVEAKGTVHSKEGCLSFPGITVTVVRHRDIVVEVMDLEGKQHHFELTGGTYEVRNMQHEIDHLDGITFIDHLSPLKRKMAESKYFKKNQSKRMRS